MNDMLSLPALLPGFMTLVTGDVAEERTVVAETLAWHYAASGTRCDFVSFDLTASEFWNRAICREGGLTLGQVVKSDIGTQERKETWRIHSALHHLPEWPCLIPVERGASIDTILEDIDPDWYVRIALNGFPLIEESSVLIIDSLPMSEQLLQDVEKLTIWAVSNGVAVVLTIKPSLAAMVKERIGALGLVLDLIKDVDQTRVEVTRSNDVALGPVQWLRFEPQYYRFTGIDNETQ